jgi:predicted acylesterase/phospholipase RssA
MSIPFIWQEVRWQDDWGLYNGRNITNHAIVDGGLNSNFPIRLLIAKSPDVIEVMGPHDGAFALGMLIDETQPVPNAPKLKEGRKSDPQSPMAIPNLPIVRRISNLVNTMTSAHDKTVMDAYKNGVCRLPAADYGTTEFDMDDDRVAALITAGRQTMSHFFDTFSPPK